jgi:hypothetical protein
MSKDHGSLLDMTTYTKELMPSKKRILLADFMTLVVAGFMALGTYYLITYYEIDWKQHSLLISILFIVSFFFFNFILFINFGYTSFGYFLLGIIHIDRNSGNKLDKFDLYEMFFKRIGYHFKYHEVYSSFYMFFSSYHQTKIMEVLGILYAKAKPYKIMKTKKEDK